MRDFSRFFPFGINVNWRRWTFGLEGTNNCNVRARRFFLGGKLHTECNTLIRDEIRRSIFLYVNKISRWWFQILFILSPKNWEG